MLVCVIGGSCAGFACLVGGRATEYRGVLILRVRTNRPPRHPAPLPIALSSSCRNTNTGTPGVSSNATYRRGRVCRGPICAYPQYEDPGIPARGATGATSGEACKHKEPTRGKVQKSEYSKDARRYETPPALRVKSITGPKQLGAGIFLPAPFQAPIETTD
jgi:hypothetical protein